MTDSALAGRVFECEGYSMSLHSTRATGPVGCVSDGWARNEHLLGEWRFSRRPVPYLDAFPLPSSGFAALTDRRTTNQASQISVTIRPAAQNSSRKRDSKSSTPCSATSISSIHVIGLSSSEV